MEPKKTENNPIQEGVGKEYKFLLTPRCGAKTRRHTPCLAPAVRGNRRCRMHGGKGSGAPKGSQNALKHGSYTREAITERRKMRATIKEWRKLKKNYDELV